MDRESVIKGLKFAWEYIRERPNKTATPQARAMHGIMKAIDLLTPKQMEIEGGGSTWWDVCPECHGAIDDSDHFCRHCGQAVTNS